MSEIYNVVVDELKKTSVSYKNLQAILIRLLEHGSICYGDSQIETELYNDAVRIVVLLQDYFAVLGCRLLHERSWQYFRLYPPGAEIPGQPQLDEQEEMNAGLDSSLNVNETAAVLILGFLYREALQQGRLDEKGEAQIRLEAFYTALQNLMKRNLPVYFWGDLDFAGMGILASLRSNFLNASAWQLGYEPMLQYLKKREGHTAAMAGKSKQIDPGQTGCSYADNVLLPALRETQQFVDQEIYTF